VTHPVVVRSGIGLRAEIAAGRHLLGADEPVDLGGRDEGPDPYQLLLASLGACTSMTLRLYAERKKWPLKAVIVRLSHSRTHREDCAHPEDPDCRIERIEREIELQGPLSEDQKIRLGEIADRCPVHRTLESELEIVTVLRG
jgi:uncharacterized OsmC-like protein